jgi:hypothetical protein
MESELAYAAKGTASGYGGASANRQSSRKCADFPRHDIMGNVASAKDFTVGN